jgi:hypothetical protein
LVFAIKLPAPFSWVQEISDGNREFCDAQTAKARLFAGSEAPHLKNFPSANILGFQFSKISMSESAATATDLCREVAGKRDTIN